MGNQLWYVAPFCQSRKGQVQRKRSPKAFLLVSPAPFPLSTVETELFPVVLFFHRVISALLPLSQKRENTKLSQQLQALGKTSHDLTSRYESLCMCVCVCVCVCMSLPPSLSMCVGSTLPLLTSSLAISSSSTMSTSQQRIRYETLLSSNQCQMQQKERELKVRQKFARV